MPQISVIVPVYQAEAYLDSCIQSILSQTFTDWELILVDDGSPDRSGAMCDAYAFRDPRIQVLHQTNQGQAAAQMRVAPPGELLLDDISNQEDLAPAQQIGDDKGGEGGNEHHGDAADNSRKL